MPFELWEAADVKEVGTKAAVNRIFIGLGEFPLENRIKFIVLVAKNYSSLKSLKTEAAD